MLRPNLHCCAKYHGSQLIWNQQLRWLLGAQIIRLYELGNIRFLIGSHPAARLLFPCLVAFASRYATSEMYEVVIRSGGAHRVQTPVAGGRLYSGKPRFRILRSRSVRVLGPQALAGTRVYFDSAHGAS